MIRHRPIYRTPKEKWQAFIKAIKPTRILIAVLLIVLIIQGGEWLWDTYKTRAFVRAEKYFAAGDYERARQEYMKVLSMPPAHSRAMEGIGTIFLERGQALTAVPYLGTARRLEPHNLGLALKLGLSYQAIGEIPKARNEAAFILKKKPAHTEALMLWVETALLPEEVVECRKRIEALQKETGEKAVFSLALALLDLKQTNAVSAEKAVIKAYNLETNFPPALVAMGNLQWSKGDVAKADSYFIEAAKLSPIRSPKQLRRVDLKFKTGAVEEAKAILADILKRAPDHLPAMVYEAKIAFSENKFDECRRLNDLILMLDKANYDARLLQARMKMAEKKNEEAMEELEALKTFYPVSHEARYCIALIHLENEEIDKAIEQLGQAITFDPTYDAAILLLAELSLRKGDAASTIQLLGPVLQRDPKLKKAHLLTASAYRARERWIDVLEVYQRMTRLFPTDTEPHLRMGQTFQEIKRIKEARRAFLKVREMEPKSLPALTHLIELDLTEKNFDEAWKRLDDEMAADPKSPDLQLLKARIHLAQDDPAKAEAAMLYALELYPAHQSAYSALARLYIESGRHQLALEKLQAGLSQNPTDLGALMLVAMIHEEKKDFAEAAKTYEHMLTKNRNYLPALNNLACLYTERLPKSDRALVLAKRARELSNDPFTADTLGWILYQRGEYSWALKLSQECAAKMPGRVEAHYHLGMAYYMEGADSAAKGAFTKALALTNHFEGREIAETRLALLNLDLTKPAAEVMTNLQAVLEKHPNDLMALLRMGATHERLEEFTKARAAYEKALKVNPKCLAAIVDLSQLFTEKLPDQAKAIEMAQRARSLAPDDAHVIEMLGLLAYKARDYPWALTLLQQSNERRPNQPGTLYFLGLFYFNLGKVSQARESMVEALRISPEFPQAEEARRFLSFVELFENPGKADQAEATVREALKADPSYVPALLAHGLIQRRKGNFPEAREIFERILARNARFTPAAKELGILYADYFEENQKATKLLAKVREVMPDDAEVARALGILAYKRDDFVWAEQLLKESLVQSHTNISSLYYLGMTHYQRKQKARSREFLEQVVALNSDDALATEARRILEKIK